MTLEKFGQRIGITATSCSLLEKGKNNPSNQTILAICREFGVSEMWLRTGEGKPGDEHAEYREQIELMKAHHAEMVAHYNRALAVKTRWLRFAVVLSLVLIAVIIAVLMLDVSRPGVGWFRS